MESFPENLDYLFEYLGYTKLINDKQKQKYEKLLFDEEENTEIIYEKKGKKIEVQSFRPKFIEKKMEIGTTNFDIVKKMFVDFGDYLGNEKKEELLSKYHNFLKLKEIFFENAKDLSLDELDTIDKKLMILEYLNANRVVYSQGMMKEELLKAIVPIIIEVQKYIIKTSHYEKEKCLLLMTDTYKCVKEEKQVLLSELLKEEKNFINEEFATNYMAYIITSRIDQYKSCQELILLYMITIFKQLKPFFNVQTIKRILSNALKITNNQKDEDFACQCVD